MKRKIVLTLSAALIFGVVVSEPVVIQAAETKELSTTQKKNLTHASWKMFKNTVSLEKKDGKLDSNIIISPLSVLSALSMAETGACGATLDEYTDKVIYSSIDDSNEAISIQNSLLNSSSLWNVANSAWIKEDYTLLSDYKAELEKYFNGEFFTEPMDDGTVKKVNNWVSDNTNGLIKDIISNLSEDTRLLLANAVAFEGKWETTYSEEDIIGEDSDAYFVGVNNKEKATYVIDTSLKSYLELNSGYGFINRYKDGDYAFFAYETPDDVTLEEYIKSITWKKLYKSLNNPLYDADEVIIQFPEFETDFSESVVSVMKKTGMKTAFSEFADLSRMITKNDGEKEDLRIDDILHKAHIEVNREGTKAAAATIVIVNATASVKESVPNIVEVRLDHPFIYGIMDTSTNLPVFIGTLTKLG